MRVLREILCDNGRDTNSWLSSYIGLWGGNVCVTWLESVYDVCITSKCSSLDIEVCYVILSIKVRANRDNVD